MVGWNNVDIEEDWFEDGWKPGMARFVQPYPMSHWCPIVAPDTTGKQICHHLPAKIKPQPPRAPEPVVGSSNWIDKKITSAPIPSAPPALPEVQNSDPVVTPVDLEIEMPTLQEAARQLKVLNSSRTPRSPLSPRSPTTPMSPGGPSSTGEAGGFKWSKKKQGGRPAPMSIEAVHSVGPSKPSPPTSAWGKPIKFSMSSGGKYPPPSPAPRPPPSQNTWNRRPNIVPDAPKAVPKVKEEDHIARWMVDTPSSDDSVVVTPTGSGDHTPQTQPPASLPTIESVASTGPAWHKPLHRGKKADPPKPQLPQISAYASLADSDEDDDEGVFMGMAGALASAVGPEPYLPENLNVDHLEFPGVLAGDHAPPTPAQAPARTEPEEPPLVCPTHGLNACKKGVCRDMNSLYMKREGNKKRLEEEKERKKKLENAKLKKREQEKRLEDERKAQEEEKLRQYQALRAADGDDDDDDEEDEDEGYKPFSFVQGVLSKGHAGQPPRNTNVAAAAAKGKGREATKDPREGKLRAFEEEPQASESDESSVEYNEEDLF